VRTSVAIPAARAANTNGSSVAKSLAECSMSSTMKSKPARAMDVTTPDVGSSIRNVPSAKPLAVPLAQALAQQQRLAQLACTGIANVAWIRPAPAAVSCVAHKPLCAGPRLLPQVRCGLAIEVGY
jgi:hypothetical protein